MLRVRRLRAQALEGLGDLEEALREIEDLRRDAQEARRYDEHLRLSHRARSTRREPTTPARRQAASALSAGDLNSHAASAWRELADAFAQLGRLEDATLAYQQALTDAGVRAAPDISYASTRSYSDG